MSGTYDLRRFFHGPVGEDFYAVVAAALRAGARRTTTSSACASGSSCWPAAKAPTRTSARVVDVAHVLGAQGIPNRVDSWGPDWEHDWPLWRAMLPAATSTRWRASAVARWARRPHRDTTDRQTGDPLDAARPAGARAHARREHVRDRRHAHRRRAGDVPRRRLVAAGAGALAVLAGIADGHFTTELGAFNLELNLDPQVLHGDCLRRMEAQLDELLRRPRAAPARPGSTSCSPASCRRCARATSRSTTWSRTRATWRSTRADEPARRGLRAAHQGHRRAAHRHDSVMVEACNASFQVHLQVTPDEFAHMYNVAQVLAGPVLAVRHELADAVRQAAVGRDAHRAVRAGGRHPPTRPPPARAQRARHVRHTTGCTIGRRDLPARTSRASARCSRPTTTRTRSPSWPRDGSPTLQALRLHTGTV